MNPAKTHWIWGFSKDFGLNGFRTGFIASKNTRVLQALEEVAYFTSVPTVVQRVLGEMIRDRKWVDAYFEENWRRLGVSYRCVTGELGGFNQRWWDRRRRACALVGVDGVGGVLSSGVPEGRNEGNYPIRYLPAQAGFFLWVDLSPFLCTPTPTTTTDPNHSTSPSTTKTAATGPTPEQERALFLQLMDEASVYISPGRMAFRSPEVGWFRIIFGMEPALLQLALGKIFTVLERRLPPVEGGSLSE